MNTSKVQNELKKLFQDIDIGYDKKHNRFTGLITMPNGRFEQAETAIRSAIAEELEGKRLTNKDHWGCDCSFKKKCCYNQAITDCQEHIKRGGGK